MLVTNGHCSMRAVRQLVFLLKTKKKNLKNQLLSSIANDHLIGYCSITYL